MKETNITITIDSEMLAIIDRVIEVEEVEEGKLTRSQVVTAMIRLGFTAIRDDPSDHPAGSAV